MADIRELTITELEAVSGGMDPNFKLCPMGSTAGGGPGVYPLYTTCATQTFVGAVASGVLAGAAAAAHKPA
jgi:hypothetical protein